MLAPIVLIMGAGAASATETTQGTPPIFPTIEVPKIEFHPQEKPLSELVPDDAPAPAQRFATRSSLTAFNFEVKYYPATNILVLPFKEGAYEYGCLYSGGQAFPEQWLITFAPLASFPNPLSPEADVYYDGQGHPLSADALAAWGESEYMYVVFSCGFTPADMLMLAIIDKQGGVTYKRGAKGTELGVETPTNTTDVPLEIPRGDGEAFEDDYCIQFGTTPTGGVSQMCGALTGDNNSPRSICVMVKGVAKCGKPSCLVNSGLTLESEYCGVIENPCIIKFSIDSKFDLVDCLKYQFVPDPERLFAQIQNLMDELMTRAPFAILDSFSAMLASLSDFTDLDNPGIHLEFTFQGFGPQQCTGLGQLGDWGKYYCNTFASQDNIELLDKDSAGVKLMKLARPIVTGIVVAGIWIMVLGTFAGSIRDAAFGRKPQAYIQSEIDFGDRK